MHRALPVQPVLKKSSSPSLQRWHHCTDAFRRSSVQPTLKAWLLRAWHALWAILWCMYRWPVVHCRFNRCLLSSSVDLQNIRSIAPMPLRRFIRQPSVRPMPLRNSAALVQYIAAINWILQIYSNSGFSLWLGISMVDWTWCPDGGLDIVSPRWIELGVSTVIWICWIISMGPKNPTNMISQIF